MGEMDAPDPERAEDRHDETISFDPVEEARALRGREAAAGLPGLSGFALVVASGPGRGRHFLLDEGAHEAGRNPEALVFLDDITVSRHHASFAVADDRLTVRDLGSTNGTYVNGQRVEATELHSGDEVIVGRFHLVVTRGA
jgi:pSer/pThr/pTyr-binding forkhead associated (FHA) protein